MFEPIRVSTRVEKPSNHMNPNVAFNSNIISPYQRKDRETTGLATIVVKNPVDNDRLLDAARGAHVNHGFVGDTEFKNSDAAPVETNKRRRRSVVANRKNQVNDGEGGPTTSTPAKKSADDSVNNYEKMYDEYDNTGRVIRKSNPNLQLIDSINKELKRVTTGFNPDTSNA